MMNRQYQRWLAKRFTTGSTAQNQMSHTKRLEEYYGDLDEHYDRDELQSVVSTLRYSTEDERRGKPNPSRIPVNGNIRNNLASYKSAAEQYCRFRREVAAGEGLSEIDAPEAPADDAEEAVSERGRLVGLERDLQAALRRCIAQLEEGLEIIDDGAERSVSSGFIDITARDSNGAIVVIELKTGTATRQAVAQVLSYMGDVTAEDPDARVRGILVAGDFDKRARAAARMVPNLALRAYRVLFQFEDVADSVG